MRTPTEFSDLVALVDAEIPAMAVGPAPVTVPLSPRHRAPIRVMRPGSFDYRDIPSRHGDTSIPFKSSIMLEEGKRG